MRAELDINTLAELIALARAKPGAVLVEIVQRKDVRDRLLHTGFRATGKSSQAFRDRILLEVPKWKDVIAKAHIKAE